VLLVASSQGLSTIDESELLQKVHGYDCGTAVACELKTESLEKSKAVWKVLLTDNEVEFAAVTQLFGIRWLSAGECCY
jgi:uncharacterized protein YpmS